MAVAKLGLPEVRRRFLQVLAQTGLDKVACEAAGIDESTLYRSIKRDPSLAEARRRAHEQFNGQADPEIVFLTRAVIVRYLQGYEEEWTSITTVIHPDGSKEERRSLKRAKRPAPEWVVRLCAPKLEGLAFGSDVSRLELSGPDGGPIKHEHHNESDLDREIERLLGVMAAREEAGTAPSAAELPAGFEAPARLGAGAPGD
jgi:hypothetical protein